MYYVLCDIMVNCICCTLEKNTGNVEIYGDEFTALSLVVSVIRFTNKKLSSNERFIPFPLCPRYTGNRIINIRSVSR